MKMNAAQLRPKLDKILACKKCQPPGCLWPDGTVTGKDYRALFMGAMGCNRCLNMVLNKIRESK